MKDVLRNFFIKSSTRAFFAQAGAKPDFSLKDSLHAYIYARWPYLYISIGTGRHPLSRWFKALSRAFKGGPRRDHKARQRAEKIAFADGYHGKVVPLGNARKLVTINRDLELGDLEQVIPYAAARDIVLQKPDHIAALECPCRASRDKPCLPLDVCLIVGEPFVGFITEHHPKRSRRISQQEAVDILEAEQQRGHVHHAFFKDAMLGRFYAICNCCSCCCGAMQAWRNGVPMLAASGYTCVIHQDRCQKCGLCIKNCQFKALKHVGKELILRTARCMGCGVCAAICPNQALELVRDPSKGVPLDIHKLMEDAHPNF